MNWTKIVLAVLEATAQRRPRSLSMVVSSDALDCSDVFERVVSVFVIDVFGLCLTVLFCELGDNDTAFCGCWEYWFSRGRQGTWTGAEKVR